MLPWRALQAEIKKHTEVLSKITNHHTNVLKCTLFKIINRQTSDLGTSRSKQEITNI